MHHRGHRVRVITASCPAAPRPYDVMVASPHPMKPARLFSAIGDAVGRDLNHVFWEERAVRLGLQVIKSSRPDVIYARGSPGCAFTVGLRLSRVSNVPLALHFADPIPATPDWQPSRLARRKHLRSVLPAQERAALITIVNRQMLDYQEKSSAAARGGGEIPPERTMVLPNPVPDHFDVGPMPRGKFVFSFLGSFFGSRNPGQLIAAFRRVAARNPDAHLQICGIWPRNLDREVESDPMLSGRVTLQGWTSDIASSLASASCLIDVDADSRDAVYTSNKLMDYLAVDRPILLISPPGSASRELVADLKRTCLVAGHDVDDIVAAMEDAIARFWPSEDFLERRKLRQALSLRSVTANLQARLAALTE
ncbi:MAG: glycosyltransferase [Alphaproteobacteria bacterium]|nr:glycosyltransferase [Alphaproteobacteria bacterium]